MSRRRNLSGFSIARMRGLFGSKDEAAVTRMSERFASEYPHRRDDLRREVGEIVEKAIMVGGPFADLRAETDAHAIAAQALASEGREWLHTTASVYHASALEEGLRGFVRKFGSPPTRAFIRGLIEGVPLFGSQPPADGLGHAAIGRKKLVSFRPGLVDLRDRVAYRVGRKRSPTEEEEAGVEFATEFVGWIDEIVDADRDPWCTFG